MHIRVRTYNIDPDVAKARAVVGGKAAAVALGPEGLAQRGKAGAKGSQLSRYERMSDDEIYEAIQRMRERSEQARRSIELMRAVMDERNATQASRS
jgi:hypothetical protein